MKRGFPDLVEENWIGVHIFQIKGRGNEFWKVGGGEGWKNETHKLKNSKIMISGGLCPFVRIPPPPPSATGAAIAIGNKRKSEKRPQSGTSRPPTGVST